ncbi:hypothetical protein FRC11_002048 [Ceratobasidium sp. 423]|nr:hypothetical protein FRC11_002048 [Ceratobasidium sp. 423]
MHAFTKLTAIVSALGFASSAVAALVNGTTTNDLADRAPYDVHNGWASWYKHHNPSAGVGSCGWQNRDDEWVAAVGTALFQEMMTNHSKACGKTTNVSWNGKTIKQFSGLGTGKLYGVSWKFN